MKIYTTDFLEELSTKLHIEAESIASNTSEDGGREKVTVEVQDEFFEFELTCEVENYKHEEETNSVDYKATVTCTEVPKLTNVFLYDYMIRNFYLETLYKD